MPLTVSCVGGRSSARALVVMIRVRAPALLSLPFSPLPPPPPLLALVPFASLPPPPPYDITLCGASEGLLTSVAWYRLFAHARNVFGDIVKLRVFSVQLVHIRSEARPFA